MISKLWLVLKGFCMGTADVIPGVSGGTMAYILGIYQHLLAAIKSFDLTCLRLLAKGNFTEALSKPHFSFIIPLFIGIFSALLFFTRVIPLPKLIVTHTEQIYGLFFGLILGSIIILTRQIKRIGVSGAIAMILGVIAGFIIVTLTPANTPENSWFIFICGALAITAMILPGVSGSFILLILGKYAYIFDAIGHFNLTVILPFALGALSGLVVFSRFLHWLLKKFHDATMLVINGILIGSLWIIWPFQDRQYIEVRGKQRLIESNPFFPEAFDNTSITACGLMLLGFLAVLILNWVAKEHKN